MNLGRATSSSALRALRCGVVLSLVATTGAVAQLKPVVEPPPVVMDPLVVGVLRTDEHYDETGMGGPAAELSDPPFSNDLVSTSADEEDDASAAVNAEMQAIAAVNPIDLAAGVSRVDVRGFPTPRLRNGFTQSGIPEILNPERTEIIQGPLTPVTGRGAPGGIQNFVTPRPRTKAYGRLSASANTGNAQSLRFETGAPLVPRKSWYRLAASWSHKDGPQDFAHRDTRSLSGSLTVRKSAAASFMVQVDYLEMDANIAPGLPEYRPTRTAKVAGPYRELETFNVAGPNAGLRKRVASASVHYEGQPTRALNLRAGVQAFMREVDEDRWTTGQYLLDTQVFGGTREPQHFEQPLKAFVAQADATLRFVAMGADHKLLASVAHSLVDYERLQRGLDAAGRNALPADVRTFDPYAPNFFRPTYDPELFRRVITDRSETTGYTTVVVSERAAFAHGRLVATLGLRSDFVAFELEDRRPGAVFSTVKDNTTQTTWHAGANLLVSPSRLLLFANMSTAFQPSTRVDARTGQLQGNDTTRGVELGAKGLFLDRRLNLTALAYAFANENISRRNPLYNDPILDAQLTQPELVGAGEEEFTGGSLNFRGQVTPQWTLSGRAAYARAVTTRSPDLPEEEGRALTRIPRYNFSLQNRYAFPAGPWQGLSMGLGLVYLADYVHSYESASRDYLEYPAYTLASFNAGYRWRQGKREHALGLTCANLLDRDLLASHARVGAGRELGVNYSLRY